MAFLNMGYPKTSSRAEGLGFMRLGLSLGGSLGYVWDLGFAVSPMPHTVSVTWDLERYPEED